MPSNEKRLNDMVLAGLPRQVTRPGYDRSALQTGIVHLGIGAFHRAHQAVMTEAVIAAGDYRWGIVGASLRSPTTRDALAAQDWLYSVATRGASTESVQVVGALRGVLVAPESPSTLIGVLADPRVKIVSLTVTEKGYCHSPATGDLAVDNADIQHDLGNAGAPRTTLGLLTAALARRRQNGHAAPTLLSCDNLLANGHTLKRLLVQFAGLSDPVLARYIEDNVMCPNTMVDRIVPATTEEDCQRIARVLGVMDAAAVVTEPFCQWVIEDFFPSGRPEWERAGAEMVDDVAPYEIMKLRLLNAAHSAIAYLGALAGFETVAEAMRDDGIARFVTGLMDEEVTPVLNLPDTFDIATYKRALIARFSNPALKHRTHQIAMDGSQKLPPRVLATVRERLKLNLPIKRLAIVVAAWMHYLAGRDERDRRHEVRDPMQAELQRRCAEAADLLDIEAIFGRDLPADTRFSGAVETALLTLRERGVSATVEPLK